jgi:hypothetical protein
VNQVERIWSFSLMCLAILVGNVYGDGGTVRLSEQVGEYLVTVFTAPTPLRAGPIDVSVLVQDAGTGKPAAVHEVLLRLRQSGEWTLEQAATQEQATNRLLHAAKFDLPAPGTWQVEVRVRGPNGEVVRKFEVHAAEPLPRWVELWGWIALPVVPVVLFLIHQALRERTPATRAGQRLEG